MIMYNDGNDEDNDDFETIDLNNKKDFEYLEYLLKYRLLKKKNFKKKKKQYLNIN